MKPRTRPLKRRLLGLAVLPALIMFLVLLFFFTSARIADARNELFSNSQLLADNLAPALEYAVVSGNSQMLNQIIGRAFDGSRADWIRVTDIGGRVMGSISDETIPERSAVDVFEADILQQPLEMNADRAGGWFEPTFGFTGSTIRLGTVEVGVSPDVLSDRQSDILWSSAIVGLALLLFTLLISRRSLDELVEPMQLLSQRIEAMTKGDYRQPASFSGTQSLEVAKLESQLNTLAKHLESLKSSREQILLSTEIAREKAEAANRAKSEFLAVMSHELRTPINGVLGMLELIGEEPLTSEQEDYLKTARRSSEDLLTIINDILDISRMDRGKLALDTTSFDANQLIQNCVASYRHLAEQQGLELNLRFMGSWPENTLVKGDPVRFRKILVGLLDNAIKFTDQGSIQVQAEWQYLEDNCAVLRYTVQDSGSGIPSNRLSEIFKTFEQLDSSHSRQHGGTGIGLALVQKLVELMGGHVNLDSDLGIGSSFSVEIPFELEENPNEDHHTATSPILAQTRNPGASRALVVEDNPVNQRVASALMSRLGFETDAVSNGRDALDRFCSGQFNYQVVLMDCQMPVMDGYEATRGMREWESQNGHSRVPIIALTADVLPGTKTACHSAGMDDYLPKPVRKDQLRVILSRWLDI
ncbi:ATP-binding protein [Marinobacter mobilis]|uniref:Sensory/regulatory protein RpfC n=1 Tax=Marinobacter mobilis TaxID=488533 RepID=A0A1H3BHP9_9GAMM|nr:ATP-binding protein [Marinobacter mobilis]SDX41427.1 Signal transduction histidine kinase [Marinobacter mobilis]